MRKGIKSLTSTSAKIYPSGVSGKGSSKRAGGSNKFSAKYSAKYAPAGERKFSAMDFVRASLHQLRKAAVGPPVIVVDKDEFISLEEKYKESLQMPIETVYRRVGDAQSRAQRMLELCEAEVQQSSFAPVDETKSLRAGAFGAEPGAYAGKLRCCLYRCFSSAAMHKHMNFNRGECSISEVETNWMVLLCVYQVYVRRGRSRTSATAKTETTRTAAARLPGMTLRKAQAALVTCKSRRGMARTSIVTARRATATRPWPRRSPSHQRCSKAS
jgi:hypothetical protein